MEAGEVARVRRDPAFRLPTLKPSPNVPELDRVDRTAGSVPELTEGLDGNIGEWWISSREMTIGMELLVVWLVMNSRNYSAVSCLCPRSEG